MSAPTYKWQPTTAEIAEKYGLWSKDVVRFDHNTSPFPTDWAPGIVAPMARQLNEYPAASYAALRIAAAEYLETDPGTIVPGAGVDEIISLVAKTYLGSGRRACAVVPTYPLYEIATLQTGAEFIAVPYDTPDFGFPQRAIGEAAETSDVTWLCIPNNPTGDRIPDGSIATVMEESKGLVVIDAAYAEFSGDRWAQWILRYDNLIVCHTMSKGFGLAALRVGFAMSSPEITAELDAMRPPGSISSMSAELAEAALQDPKRMDRRVQRLTRERSRFADKLTKLGIGVRASDANFLMCEIGPNASEIADDLMTEGLVVRRFPSDGPIANFLRFTVRAPDENDRLIDALWRRLP